MLAEHDGKQEQQQRTQKESVDKEQASSVHESEMQRWRRKAPSTSPVPPRRFLPPHPYTPPPSDAEDLQHSGRVERPAVREFGATHAPGPRAAAHARMSHSLRGGPLSTGCEAPCSGVDGEQVSKPRQSLRKSELPVFCYSGRGGGREQRGALARTTRERRGDVQNAGAPVSGKAPRAHRSRPPPWT